MPVTTTRRRDTRGRRYSAVFLRMLEIASPTLVIFSTSSSGMSQSNSSSSAMTNSTVSSESAPRSSTKRDSGVIFASSTAERLGDQFFNSRLDVAAFWLGGLLRGGAGFGHFVLLSMFDRKYGGGYKISENDSSKNPRRKCNPQNLPPSSRRCDARRRFRHLPCRADAPANRRRLRRFGARDRGGGRDPEKTDLLRSARFQQRLSKIRARAFRKMRRRIRRLRPSRDAVRILLRLFSPPL